MGVFWKNWSSEFIQKHPKLFCLYHSNHFFRGHFVFKPNGRILFFTSYKDDWCSFFTSWVIKQQKCWISQICKKHPISGVQYTTLDMNCINQRFQLISCIGLEMVKTYFKLFLEKIYSKCLSYTGECHIYVVCPSLNQQQIIIRLKLSEQMWSGIYQTTVSSL